MELIHLRLHQSYCIAIIKGGPGLTGIWVGRRFKKDKRKNDGGHDLNVPRNAGAVGHVESDIIASVTRNSILGS
jgi:glycine cleavage system protein P-like pyridoxal-binding family